MHFINQLSVVNEGEKADWNDVKQEEFSTDKLTTLWYASSGTDSVALARLNEAFTSKNRLPTIDLFIFSDYSKRINDFLKISYDKFDDETIKLKSTWLSGSVDAEITQMIPLVYFTNDERNRLREKYKDRKQKSTTDSPLPSDIDFYYCKVEIDDEYFPVLYTTIENTILYEEILKKESFGIEYICTVCDGCHKGGAWLCMSDMTDKLFFKDILQSKIKPKYWITDHFRNYINYPDPPEGFFKIADFGTWGARDNDSKYGAKLYKVE